MLSGLFEQSSNGAKIVAAIFIILISVLIFTFLGIFLSLPLFSLSFSEAIDSMNLDDNTNIAFMKYFQTVISLGTFVLPPFIIAYVLKGEIKKYLYFQKAPLIFSIFLVGLIMILAIPFINYMAEWNAKLVFPESLAGLESFMKSAEKDAEQLTMAFLKSDGIGTLFINLFVIALIPAVGEELLFRGIFQKIIIDWTRNAHIGIWTAAFLFSAMHFQFYGFVPRMLMGAFFGYLLVWSESMWLPIVAHFVNNAFAVIAYYLMGQSVIGDQAETLGTGEGSLTAVSVSITMVILLIYALFRLEREKKESDQPANLN